MGSGKAQGMEPSPRLAAMQCRGHDPELGAPAQGQKQSPGGGTSLGSEALKVYVSLLCGTEQEPKAGSSGMARESPPALQCAPHPGRAPLTAPVGEVRPPMEHVPTGHPREPRQHPHRPGGGSPGAAPSLLQPQSQPCRTKASGDAHSNAGKWEGMAPQAVPPAS